MPKKTSQVVLFEMFRSFISLADTLNLSKTIKILGSTRQTVRRHIGILEKTRGEQLFDVVDRQYCLTEAGNQSLKEARAIIAHGDAWIAGTTHSINGLERVRYLVPEGQSHHSQQHHLSRLWIDGTPLLQHGFQCWAKAGGRIEDAALAPIRPYIMVYRLSKHGWQCAELGDKSVYAFWFGWKWAKSNIGRIVGDQIFGATFVDSILQSYYDVYEQGGIRLDHIHRVSSRGLTETIQPSSYQRLLLGGTFPDGGLALIILSELTHNIEVYDFSLEQFGEMPDSLLEEYNSEIGNINLKQ